MQALLAFAVIFLAGVAGLPSNVDVLKGQSRAPLRIRGGGLVTKEQMFDITAGLGLVQVSLNSFDAEHKTHSMGFLSTYMFDRSLLPGCCSCNAARADHETLRHSWI